MKKIINRTLIFIMSFTTLIYLIDYVGAGNYSRILPCVSILPVIFVPKILSLLNFKFNEDEELVYYIFIFVAHFLGAIVDCYDKICFFDIIAHTLSGVVSFIFGLKLLKQDNKKIKLNAVNIIFLTSFCFLISGGWEIVEFIGDKLFKANFQHSVETGVADTMEDMIYAFVGYVVALLSYLKISKNN